MQTAVEWLLNRYVETNKIVSSDVLQAKEMEKQQTLLFSEEYDEYVFRGGSAIVEQYYEETFKNQQDI